MSILDELLGEIPVEGGIPGPEPVRLHLGCGRDIKPGWINVDLRPGPGIDFVTDLNNPNCFADYPNDVVDEFLMSHVLEHITNSLPLMQQLHRIAKPGARLTARTPYGSSDDAWEDPTHVRAYYLQSFGYFSQPFYWRADYQYRGDWQTDRIDLLIEAANLENRSHDEISRSIRTERNFVREMVAHLSAVKPIREPLQTLQNPLKIKIISVVQ
jgi:SAM-dependent methyltransferase